MDRVAPWKSFAASVAILLVLLARPCPSAPGDPPRTEGLDAIIIADTLKGPAGTRASGDEMHALLDLVREMGFDVNVTRLPADQISPGNIRNAIRTLDPARMRKRTLLVYYAGHGGTDLRTGHFLSTPGGPLLRSALLEEIRAKEPALALLVTDCCSTRATFNLKQVPTPAAAPPERRAMENLLFQHRGVVDINGSSARPGKGDSQAAFYHPNSGGLFTNAFASMFRDPGRLPRPLPGTADLTPDQLGEYLARFGAAGLLRHDRDKDGFIEWSEAAEYLADTLLDLYEEFRTEVRSGELSLRARPDDLRKLLSQVSQDPQVFGPLAVRSDRPAIAPVAGPQPRPSRPARFGVVLDERIERGGGYVVIESIERRSPATRAFVWKNGLKAASPVPMLPADSIIRANNVRVRTRQDFVRVLDSIPEGGELNITGKDARTGRPYRASVILDRYE